MARASNPPFRDLLVEAFQDLSVPTPRSLLGDDDEAIDQREETRPDRRRPRRSASPDDDAAPVREHTLKDVELPWALRTSAPAPTEDSDDGLEAREPTRPVDLRRLAAVLEGAPPSLPVAIGAHTGVYRFTLNTADVLEPLEPLVAPAPVEDLLAAHHEIPDDVAREARTPAVTPHARAVARATRPLPSAVVPRDPLDDAPPRATRRAVKTPRPPSSRERARALYLEALDALAAARVDEARQLCGQAVTLAPREPQYRALFVDLETKPSAKRRRSKRSS